MTEREQDDVEVPERTHDQPAEGGREEADGAAEPSTGSGPEGGEAAGETVE